MEKRQFEKLKLLFWRYFAPEQRLSLLKECGLVPETTKRPLTNAAEQVILDDSDESNLAQLWSKIINAIPKSER